MEINQLIREDIDLEYEQYRRTFVYEYDNQGNITFIKEHYYTTASTVTTTQISRKEFSYDNTWGDQLTNYSEYLGSTLVKDIDYSYDNSGNPTYELDGISGASVEYEWDERQMTGYYTAEWGNSFKYNDQGIRTQKGSTHKFVLDGDKVIVETIGSTTIYYTYDVDGSLLSMNYNGSEYFYITNMQGDVIELVDINGNSVAKYKYDAWGNMLYQSGSMADENPYRYRGYRFDEDTGLYYLQSRYYNPETGRFISADGNFGPNGNAIGHNSYAYTKNSPILYTDPDGEWGGIDDLIAGAVGAVVGVVGQYASDVYDNIVTDGFSVDSFKPSSSWETYAGAAIGGFVGGVAFLYLGPAGTGAVTGFVTTFTAQGLESMTGTNQRSFGEIMFNSSVDGIAGAAMGKLCSNIPGINKGRNSYSAQFKSGLTKFANGSARGMANGLSKKVLTRGFTQGIIGGLGLDLWYGMKQAGEEEGLNTFDLLINE